MFAKREMKTRPDRQWPPCASRSTSSADADADADAGAVAADVALLRASADVDPLLTELSPLRLDASVATDASVGVGS